MHTTSFTYFRNHAAQFLGLVEQGQDIIITRHSKPIAKIVPIFDRKTYTQSWKTKALRLPIKGVSLSTTILQDRKEKLK